ncbi:histone-like nucleoid-structuring protein Lsr2 [Sciscionella sediminilitoris]|uniref:histone-like nucleoid-structuring protein Lsr2 n=1 Tax=Sciscionella sediminilitoris TaxID=1445613 RepID=UPI00068E4C45|nr:Lsr2 family protein [Sciscionella sp. SE31]
MERTVIQLVDDLDGTEAEETITFRIDSTTYEIDLSKPNAETFRHQIEPFITNARIIKQSGRTTTLAKSNPVPSEQTKAIRKWARNHGYSVSDRGRIPEAILEEFHRR